MSLPSWTICGSGATRPRSPTGCVAALIAPTHRLRTPSQKYGRCDQAQWKAFDRVTGHIDGSTLPGDRGGSASSAHRVGDARQMKGRALAANQNVHREYDLARSLGLTPISIIPRGEPWTNF